MRDHKYKKNSGRCNAIVTLMNQLWGRITFLPATIRQAISHFDFNLCFQIKNEYLYPIFAIWEKLKVKYS